MSIYDYTVKNRDGLDVPLSEYRGKVLLIVNTATGCGFTPQYKGLQWLYDKYQAQGFEILDFPCDQFGHQAPGSDAEIHEFCTRKFKTKFDQFHKIDVNGPGADPLYTYLKSQQGFNGFSLEGKILEPVVQAMDPHYQTSSDIKWNFTKFLVNRSGQVVARFESTVKPEELAPQIQKLLNEAPVS